MKRTADSIRKSLDRSKVSRMLSRWPTPFGIAAGQDGDSHLVSDGLPVRTERKLAVLRARLTDVRIELALDRERYGDIRRRGMDAISDPDLIAYDTPTAALTDMLDQRAAQVAYDLATIVVLEAAIEGVRVALERERPQLALF